MQREGRAIHKGDLHASEQTRPDVMEAREAWFEGQLDLNPERVVFLDETATASEQARDGGLADTGQAAEDDQGGHRVRVRSQQRTRLATEPQRNRQPSIVPVWSPRLVLFRQRSTTRDAASKACRLCLWSPHFEAAMTPLRCRQTRGRGDRHADRLAVLASRSIARRNWPHRPRSRDSGCGFPACSARRPRAGGPPRPCC